MSIDRRVLGGLALAAAAAGAGVLVSRVVPVLSPTLVAIFLGMLAGNVVPLAPVRPGLDIAGRRVLRIGIVLLGLQLSLGDIAALGPGVALLAAAIVAAGVPIGIWLGRRLGVHPDTGVLTACGFSICGAAAIAAAGGVIGAHEDETGESLALVVLFGTLVIPLPVLVVAPLWGPGVAGIWTGGAVHEVAQVVAAAGLVGANVLAVAIVVKLARVLMLAPVMTVLAVRRRQQLLAGRVGHERIALPPVMPLFVAGFLAAVLVRTFVPLPVDVRSVASTVQGLCLAAAMFALGTGVRFGDVRRLGAPPILHAVACTAVVSAMALAGALALS